MFPQRSYMFTCLSLLSFLSRPKELPGSSLHKHCTQGFISTQRFISLCLFTQKTSVNQGRPTEHFFFVLRIWAISVVPRPQPGLPFAQNWNYLLTACPFKLAGWSRSRIIQKSKCLWDIILKKCIMRQGMVTQYTFFSSFSCNFQCSILKGSSSPFFTKSFRMLTL